MPSYSIIFFFQAEDGIRDVAVTGVQTCALPILRGRSRVPHRRATGAGGARRGRGVALARAYRRAGREAAAVPANRRVGAGGPRHGTAHRYVQPADPDLAAERAPRDGGAAKPLAQSAAGAGARRRLGREGGVLELGSV